MPQRVHHPIFARLYARTSAALERSGVGELRQELLAGMTGAVIEVGAGNGMNFSHYPQTVTSILAVEPEPHLRALAEQNARHARVPITVTNAIAEHLPVEDASFDGAVATLVLCSARDQAAALAELRRVIKPGGELRFLEHVVAETSGLRAIQRLADATAWPIMFGNCHTSRDTVAAVQAAGFRINDLKRCRIPDMSVQFPTSPHVRGVATRV